MSGPRGIFIFAAILRAASTLVASTAPFAQADPITSTTDPTDSSEHSELIPLTNCEKLDTFEGIYDLDSHGFAQTVKACNDEFRSHTTTPSNGTAALLEVYNAIKGGQCTFTEELQEELIGCVNKEIGFQPPFTNATAKQHFGPNKDTASLQFKDQECLNSAKVRKCVELKFSQKKIPTTLLGCKQSIMRGFNITASICRKDLVRDDRGSGIRSLPSDLLILGSAIMLVKLTVFSRI